MKLQAKLRVDNKNNIYYLLAKNMKAYMGSKVYPQMVFLDYISGRFEYHGPIKRLP